MNEKLLKLQKALNDKKKVDSDKRLAVVEKYKAKAKVKKLTQEERIARIEEMLGIE